MEENNKFETKENRSGSTLYGAEPQMQEDQNVYSSAYGTKLEPQDVVSLVPPTQQSNPIVIEEEETQKITPSIQSAQSSESVEIEPIQESNQSQPVQLTKSVTVQEPQKIDTLLQSGELTESTQIESTLETQSSSPTIQRTNLSETEVAHQTQQPQVAFQQQEFTGGDSIGFGPMQAPPPIQGAPASKPKKKKTGLIAGILCVAAIVIVIGTGVLLAKSILGGDGKNQLAKGFANMSKEMVAYQNSVVKDIGLVELNKLKKTKPIHTNIDLSFTDPQSFGTFSNIDVEVDVVSDYSKKMAELALSLGTYGIDMDLGKLIAADNTVYLSVPIIFQDKIYSFDLTNLGRDFNNSAWSKITNEKLPEDYSLTLFEEIEMSESIKKAGEMREIYELIQKQTKAIAASIKIETLKEKREFSFDDIVEYGGVQVTVDQDAYNQAIEALCDDILESNYYAEFMRGYESTFRGNFDELKENMDNMIKYMFGMRFEEDILLDFYLDKKGRIVNISTPQDLAVSSDYVDVESISVDINFSGTERALDCIDGGVYLQAGEEILYFGISRMAEITEDSYTEDLTFQLQEADSNDEITFWYSSVWGYEDQSYELQMQMDTPESSIGLSADGAYTNVKKGERYTIEIDHAAITVDDEDFLLMIGSITTELGENKIEVPENAINILEMSEEDITSLLYGTVF